MASDLQTGHAPPRPVRGEVYPVPSRHAVDVTVRNSGGSRPWLAREAVRGLRGLSFHACELQQDPDPRQFGAAVGCAVAMAHDGSVDCS